jgi:dTDP-4-dehydrorhamnose reductase
MGDHASHPRVLVTGASGHLGSYLSAELGQLGQHVGSLSAWSGPQFSGSFPRPGSAIDLTDARQVELQLERDRPDVILHAAAWSRVDACQQQPAVARQVNVDATARLAEWARRRQVRLLFVSTDLVFDGTAAPYSEQAPPAPLSVYGATKWEAEQAVLATPHALVARLSLLYGPSRTGRVTFFDQQWQALQRPATCRLFVDEWRTPLATHVAARLLSRLALSDHAGLVHVGGPERMSRWEMGVRLARFLGLPTEPLVPVHRADQPAPEPRPCDVSLDSSRLGGWFPDVVWPSYEQTLEDWRAGGHGPPRS